MGSYRKFQAGMITTGLLMGLLLFGGPGKVLAQQQLETAAPKSYAGPSVEDQLRRLIEEVAALRQELAELKEMRMAPGQMPMAPGMAGPLRSKIMRQPAQRIIQACTRIMQELAAQEGGMTPPLELPGAGLGPRPGRPHNEGMRD